MKLLGILFLLCVLTMPVLAQDHCRIMFYNVENLFDTADDPSTADDEFTPRGKKHWTKAKYTDKLLKIAEVIDSVGDKELPCIVGLAEVENRWVLEDLTQKTALADGNYGIVHQDSPDGQHDRDQSGQFPERMPIPIPRENVGDRSHPTDRLISGISLRKE